MDMDVVYNVLKYGLTLGFIGSTLSMLIGYLIRSVLFTFHKIT